MALATAMVNSPDVFQCLASAALTVDWASAGSDRARNNSRFVFMVCLGTISHIAEGAARANGREGKYWWRTWNKAFARGVVYFTSRTDAVMRMATRFATIFVLLATAGCVRRDGRNSD